MPRKQAEKSKSRTQVKATPAKPLPPVKKGHAAATKKPRNKHPAMKKSPLFGNPAIAPLSPEGPITPASKKPEPAPLPLPESVVLAAFQANEPARHAPLRWPAGMASVLAGTAAGWQYLGVDRIFQAEIDPLPATTAMVTVIALLSLVIGMLAPARLAPLGRRFSRIQTAGTAGGPNGDANLPWLRLALLSAACAFASLLAVAVGGPMLRAYHHLLDRFFWNNISLAGLEWLFVTALLAGPCLTMGAVVAAIAGSAQDSGGKGTGLAGVLPGLLFGITLAMLASTLPGWAIWAERQVVVGTLPVFALAAGALWISSKPRRAVAGPADPDSPNQRASFAAEDLARGTPLLWAFLLTLACTGWLACRPEGQADAGRVPALMLGLIGASHVAASVFSKRVGRVPASGSSVWLCGLGTGLAAILAAGWGERWWAPGLEAALITVPVGQGLSVMSRIGQDRSSNQAARLIHFAVMALSGAALGVAAGQWWGLPQLGAMGTLTTGSLALLGLGGLLEVHGRVRSVRAEQIRLAIVFGSLAAAIIVFPALTQTWTRRDNQRFAAGAIGAPSIEILGKALAGVRTACLIGVDETVIGRLPEGRATLIEILPLASWLPERAPHPSDERVHLSSMPAARAFRLNRTRYQLVYQALRPPGGDPAVYCSAEWLSQLQRHVAAGGTLMLDLPLTGLNRSQVRDLAATFRHASPGGCCWKLIAGAGPRLLLQCRQDHVPDRTEQAGWTPVDQLLTGADSVPHIYSIRRPSAGERPGVQDSESAASWLAMQIRSGGPVARVAMPTGLPR